MYEYFIFLNSSVRGPFFPSYMPRAWQWTQAFTQGLTKVTKIVGSSLVCLPPQDPGGYGPKVMLCLPYSCSGKHDVAPKDGVHICMPLFTAWRPQILKSSIVAWARMIFVHGCLSNLAIDP